MKGYLNKTYDCEKIFSAEGEERNALILMFAIDITVYHIFCQHNPYKLAKIRLNISKVLNIMKLHPTSGMTDSCWKQISWTG